MNKKQIETRIKIEANNIEVPDLKQQILAQVPNRKVIVKEPKKRFSFALRFSYVTAVLVLVLLAVVITKNINSGNIEDGATDNGNTIETPTNTTKNVSETEKAYAKQASTLAGFMDVSDSSVDLVSSIGLLSTDTDYASMAEEINKYFTVISNLLDEESTEYTLEVLTEGKYTYKLTVKYTILNDIVETIIYYNETPVNDANLDKEDLDEVSTTLEGKIVQGGIHRPFYGEKQVDGEEVEIALTLQLGNNNYLKVSQENEEDERDLSYAFYSENPKYNKNLEPYKEINIDIEEKDGYKDVKVKFMEDGIDFEIEFKYGKDIDRDHVRVDYKKGDEKHQGIELHENNKNEYRFDFGEDYSQSVPKGHGHRNHDEDENDD